MKTVAKKNLYEGMFLVDSAEAGTDWDGVIASITKILERARAEIVSVRKWDDRRLAYDIRSVSRGTYILTYFRVEGQEIENIEKAVQLSERIMRVLILSTENMSAQDIEKDTPATRAEKQESEPAPEARAAQPGEQKETPAVERAEAPDQARAEQEQAPAAEEAKAPDQAEGEQEEDSQESPPKTEADH
ncbi:MAG: 30S ribosomal protein S6 [Phycisphaerales bacterium]|nr:MAG: 30S ribosomal protein S6 [Phycisphaerales bacterium]